MGRALLRCRMELDLVTFAFRDHFYRLLVASVGRVVHLGVKTPSGLSVTIGNDNKPVLRSP